MLNRKDIRLNRKVKLPFFSPHRQNCSVDESFKIAGEGGEGYIQWGEVLAYMIFVIYWECISLGAGTRVGESYNLLGICVVVVMVRGVL